MPPVKGGGRTRVNFKFGSKTFTKAGGTVAFTSNYATIVNGMRKQAADLVRQGLVRVRERIIRNMDQQNNDPSLPGQTAYPQHGHDGLQGSFNVTVKTVRTPGSEGVVGAVWSSLNYAFYLEYGAQNIFGIIGLVLLPRPTIAIAYEQAKEVTKERMSRPWPDLEKLGRTPERGGEWEKPYPDLAKLIPKN
jgi:hypothetical protein